ncbi:MAG TPA: hypothetical protein P5024_12235 [Burkholderiaceae bacterium]|nr:hypothetical protein [Burkholderiaceae bacterium]
MSANRPRILAVIGASGSGKSLFIKAHLWRSLGPRVLVWDPLAEYGPHVRTVTRSAAELVRLVAGPAWSIAFQPSADAGQAVRQFDLVCRAALAARRCALVVEELAFVTTPARAPAGWRAVCLTGRHAGLTVVGASQRPASIDKDFFSNATAIRCGRLNYSRDLSTMADVLGVPSAELQRLEPLAFVARDMTTGKLDRGRLKVPPKAGKLRA